MKSGYSVRPAVKEDSDGILAVYAPFITDTYISFETEVPTKDDFAARTAALIERYPYFVCECGETIVGYAYASPYAARAAYRYSVDVSVYVAPKHQGAGIGTELYERLFEELGGRNFYTAVAIITASNQRSIDFHGAWGFLEAGRFANVGYKHGRWLDIVCMERKLQDYPEIPNDAD